MTFLLHGRVLPVVGAIFCISLVFYSLFSQRAYAEQCRQRRAWLGRQNGGWSARRNFSKPHEKMVVTAKASTQRLNFASMAFGQNGFSESIRTPCFDWPFSLLLDELCHADQLWQERRGGRVLARRETGASGERCGNVGDNEKPHPAEAGWGFRKSPGELGARGWSI